LAVFGLTFFLAVKLDQETEVHILSDTGFDTVFVIKNPEIDDVFVDVIFPSGEMKNPYAEGLAHYVEHLAWLSALPPNGETRHSNAWTNLFTTGYWLRSSKTNLKSDLSKLLRVADEIDLEDRFALDERGIVLREYDFRLAERPLFSVYKDMRDTLFEDSVYRRSVIGTQENIQKFSLEQGKALHAISHDLTTATLLVYGNVDAKFVEDLVVEVSKDLAGSSSDMQELSLGSDFQSKPLNDRKTMEVKNLVEDQLIYQKLVKIDACADIVTCDVLFGLANRALDSTLDGGIAGPLRFDEFVARSFSFSVWRVGMEHAIIEFNANPDKGIDLDRLEKVFLQTLGSTLQNGLPEATFERVHNRMIDGMGEVDDLPAYNFNLVRDQVSIGEPIYTYSDRKAALDNIQLSDINNFLTSLARDGRVVTRLAQIKN